MERNRNFTHFYIQFLQHVEAWYLQLSWFLELLKNCDQLSDQVKISWKKRILSSIMINTLDIKVMHLNCFVLLFELLYYFNCFIISIVLLFPHFCLIFYYFHLLVQWRIACCWLMQWSTAYTQLLTYRLLDAMNICLHIIALHLNVFSSAFNH